MARHILEVDDLAPGELKAVLELASSPSLPRVLDGKGVALVFQKPSARTRNSSEMAIVSLGGHPVVMRGDEVGLGTGRETPQDLAMTLACYHAVIGARVFDHAILERMADALDDSKSPVSLVNLLSDLAHPLQALADVLTLRQCFGRLEGLKLAYLGDSNNVCKSLVYACCMLGVSISVASPEGFTLGTGEILRAQELAAESGSGMGLNVVATAKEAVAGADAVYTDVWTSMGQEAEIETRRKAFKAFTVSESLMAGAQEHAIFLHCLPAHRGEEVSAEVIDGARSRVWQQAANRMTSMRGLLAWLVAENHGERRQ